MSGVFLSYRRADAQGWAGRLGADLATAYGDGVRFYDLASIAPGADFLQTIEQALDGAAAVLVLIGPTWLDLRDAQGTRRLDKTDDVVAVEVTLALTRTVPVIPVLLGGAPMPAAAALPERLRALAGRNALELSDQRWDFDRDRLLAALEAATPLKRKATAPAAGGVSVGAGLRVDNSEVGRVSGVRGPIGPTHIGNVDVLQNATLSNSKVGDITGVDVSPNSKT